MALNKKQYTPEEALVKIRTFCNYRERCHAEVRTKLYDLGFRKLEVEKLITQMIDENLLNEQRYAESFARGYFRTKSWGKSKIKAALMAHSINDKLIARAMDQIDDQEYEQTISRLIQLKLRILRNGDASEKRAKTSNYLLSKGYSFNDFSELLNKLIPRQ